MRDLIVSEEVSTVGAGKAQPGFTDKAVATGGAGGEEGMDLDV